jgi:cytochrome c-type biogenesis protein
MYGAGNLGSSSTVVGVVVSSITGVLILVMGLNLLGIVKFEFPSLDLNNSVKSVDGNLRAFLVGATTAVVASPCSSPVLSSLLTAVAASGNPVLGTTLLFSYSLGYATPVVAAGALSGSVTTAANKQGFPVVNTVLASALVGCGTYSVLNSVYYALL